MDLVVFGDEQLVREYTRVMAAAETEISILLPNCDREENKVAVILLYIMSSVLHNLPASNI